MEIKLIGAQKARRAKEAASPAWTSDTIRYTWLSIRALDRASHVVGRSKQVSPCSLVFSEGASGSSESANPAREGGCPPWMESRGRARQRGQWLVTVFRPRTSKALKGSQGLEGRPQAWFRGSHRGRRHCNCEALGAHVLLEVGQCSVLGEGQSSTRAGFSPSLLCSVRPP